MRARPRPPSRGGLGDAVRRVVRRHQGLVCFLLGVTAVLLVLLAMPSGDKAHSPPGPTLVQSQRPQRQPPQPSPPRQRAPPPAPPALSRPPSPVYQAPIGADAVVRQEPAVVVAGPEGADGVQAHHPPQDPATALDVPAEDDGGHVPRPRVPVGLSGAGTPPRVGGGHGSPGGGLVGRAPSGPGPVPAAPSPSPAPFRLPSYAANWTSGLASLCKRWWLQEHVPLADIVAEAGSAPSCGPLALAGRLAPGVAPGAPPVDPNDPSSLLGFLCPPRPPNPGAPDALFAGEVVPDGSDHPFSLRARVGRRLGPQVGCSRSAVIGVCGACLGRVCVGRVWGHGWATATRALALSFACVGRVCGSACGRVSARHRACASRVAVHVHVHPRTPPNRV
jgi:hypothetical protein